MLHVHLLYTSEDPTVGAVRESLRDALHMLDMPPRWQELRTSQPELPPFAEGVATPAVFIDGKVVGNPAARPPSRGEIYMALQAHARR